MLKQNIFENLIGTMIWQMCESMYKIMNFAIIDLDLFGKITIINEFMKKKL